MFKANIIIKLGYIQNKIKNHDLVLYYQNGRSTYNLIFSTPHM